MERGITQTSETSTHVLKSGSVIWSSWSNIHKEELDQAEAEDDNQFTEPSEQQELEETDKCLLDENTDGEDVDTDTRDEAYNGTENSEGDTTLDRSNTNKEEGLDEEELLHCEGDEPNKLKETEQTDKHLFEEVKHDEVDDNNTYSDENADVSDDYTNLDLSHTKTEELDEVGIRQCEDDADIEPNKVEEFHICDKDVDSDADNTGISGDDTDTCDDYTTLDQSNRNNDEELDEADLHQSEEDSDPNSKYKKSHLCDEEINGDDENTDNCDDYTALVKTKTESGTDINQYKLDDGPLNELKQMKELDEYDENLCDEDIDNDEDRTDDDNDKQLSGKDREDYPDHDIESHDDDDDDDTTVDLNEDDYENETMDGEQQESLTNNADSGYDFDADEVDGANMDEETGKNQETVDEKTVAKEEIFNIEDIPYAYVIGSDIIGDESLNAGTEESQDDKVATKELPETEIQKNEAAAIKADIKCDTEMKSMK